MINLLFKKYAWEIPCFTWTKSSLYFLSLGIFYNTSVMLLIFILFYIKSWINSFAFILYKTKNFFKNNLYSYSTWSKSTFYCLLSFSLFLILAFVYVDRVETFVSGILLTYLKNLNSSSACFCRMRQCCNLYLNSSSFSDFNIKDNLLTALIWPFFNNLTINFY